MAANYKVEWPMNLGAPADSLEAKQPPVDDGLDVPDPARYYTREFMDLEWQRLWPRVWLLAGVTSDVAEEGDYFVFEIGSEEFIISRQPDGTVKAFYNVCPHRGGPLAEGTVEHGKIVCPWHQWEFDLVTGVSTHSRDAKAATYALQQNGDDVLVEL